MNTIERVDISGLWGYRDVSLAIRPDVTFLIGDNGTGKTTVIDLVVAALSVDFTVLQRIDFDSITITFKQFRGRKKPSVYVHKEYHEHSGSHTLRWHIKESRGAVAEEFAVKDVPERAFMQLARHRAFRQLGFDIAHLQGRLAGMFRLSWLSVQRSSPLGDGEDQQAGISAVDAKLAELSNRFTKFFSELDSSAKAETRRFQEEVFLSLLVRGGTLNLPSPDELNLAVEKEQLTDIYRLLEVPESRFKNRVSKHFETVAAAVERLADAPTVTWEDATTLILNSRVHGIVGQWNSVKQAQEDVYGPRERFLDTLNSLMPRKKFVILPDNSLAVRVANGHTLDLSCLSSGEKQMIIILGEALLQKGEPTIYIADEPEISLHVKWQESLVDNVLRLNPAAQVFFATHSPDIVAHYGQTNVIELGAH